MRTANRQPASPQVTIAVPSYNQGRFLDDALKSIFIQGVPIEVFVADGGSKDESVEIIKRWSDRLTHWRSYADAGQAAAINECISRGTAPYVCWLNSDDLMLPTALESLIAALEQHPEAPAAYGRSWNLIDATGERRAVWVTPFDEYRLALRCIVSQPATLIRRSAWEAVGGVDESLHMAMDYDLWWKLFKHGGPMHFVDKFIAINREHDETKTKTKRREHYREAISVVRKYYGRVPLKWWIAQPYAVWYRSLIR